MFHTYITEPLFNVLIFFYQTAAFHDLGIAIILLTIFVRLIFIPLFHKSAKSQMILQKIQPMVQKIQHDHKDNKEKLAQATLEIYKKYKVNPFLPFLLLIVQLPVLIALYRFFIINSAGGSSVLNIVNWLNLDYLYGFVSNPGHLNTLFLGLIDLSKSNILIVVLAAIAQYYQSRLTLPKTEKGKELSTAEKIGKQMVFMGPLFTIFILWSLPSALGVYWLTTSVFSLIQQIYINKKVKIDIE